MVLVNAIYFKGMWKIAFDRARTRSGQFRGVGGVATTDFMNLSGQRFPAKTIPELDSRVSYFNHESICRE